MKIEANVLAALRGITSETIKKGYRRPELLDGGGFLKKFSVAPGEMFKVIFPLRLSLPYNPFNPVGDEEFGEDLLWGSPYSVTSTIEGIKEIASQDEKVKSFYDKLAGGDWKIVKGEMTEQDKSLFWKNRKIETFIETTMNIRCMGDYGRKVRANIVTDSMGTVVSGDAIYHMHLLAKDINNIDYNRVKEEYTTGAKKNQPEQAKKDALTAERRKMQITGPTLSAIAPILAFKVDNDESLPVTTDLKSVIQYMSFPKDDREKIEAGLNTPYDNQWDYLEINITNSAPVGTTSHLDIYKGREYDKKPTTRIAKAEGFVEAFRQLKDENEAISDKVMKKSVPAFNTIAEEFVVDAFAPVLLGLEDKITKEIFETHQATISSVSDELALRLSEKYLDGDMLSIEGSADKTATMIDKNKVTGVDAFEEDAEDLLAMAGAGLEEVDIA